jgi:hypothetical protein
MSHWYAHRLGSERVEREHSDLKPPAAAAAAAAAAAVAFVEPAISVAIANSDVQKECGT